MRVRYFIATLAGFCFLALATEILSADGRPPDRYFINEHGDLCRASSTSKPSGEVVAKSEQFATTRNDAIQEYAFFSADEQPHLTLAICNAATGAVAALHTIKDDDADLGNSIDSFEILHNGSSAVELHVNPDLGVLVHVEKNGTHHSFPGYFFVWSHDQKSVAYAQAPPHFGSPKDAKETFYIDDRACIEMPRSSLRSIEWSSDDKTVEISYEATPKKIIRKSISVKIKKQGEAK